MISGLDHVALTVRDLDAAVDGYRRMLGVEPNWIGGDGGARHAWFQLPNMALDIIAPHGEGAFGDRIRDHLDHNGEGIWAMAFAVDDIEAACRLLKRRGVEASAPGSVRSTHDDGRKRYWTTASLEPAATGGVQLLLVAPPRDGQPWPRSDHAGAAAVSGLDHIVLWTPNPERAQAIYGARLGLDMRLDRTNPDWGSRLMFFRCGDLVVEIAHRLGGEVDPATPDGFYGFSWRTDDLEGANARMAAAGFDVSELRTGRRRGTRVFTVRDAPAGVPTIIINTDGAAEV